MKKIVAFLITLILIFLPFKTAQAKGEDKNIIVTSKEIINKNPYFAAGNNVEISGIINGDVFAAGNNISISGKVNGDVFAAGNNIKISGSVSKNILVAGGNIIISGKIGGKAFLAGGLVDLSKDSSIASYLMLAGGTTTLSGPINGDVFIGAGTTTLDSTVKGNVLAGVGTITVNPRANISGNVTYWSENELTLNKQAKVGGKIEKHLYKGANFNNQFSQMGWKKIAAGIGKVTFTIVIIKFISTLIAGLLLIHFFPKFMQIASEKISTDFWKNLGLGLISLILVPISFIILLITVVGIPIALIIMVLFSIMAYLTQIFAAYWLGKKLLPKNTTQWSFVLGLLIFSLLVLIPIVGGVTKFLVLTVGLGAILSSKVQVYKEIKNKEII